MIFPVQAFRTHNLRTRHPRSEHRNDLHTEIRPLDDNLRQLAQTLLLPRMLDTSLVLSGVVVPVRLLARMPILESNLSCRTA